MFININWGDNAAAEVRRHCERRPTRIGGHLPLHTLKEDSAGHGSSALPTSFAGIYGVLEHELFAAFQRLRWPVIEWLRSHPAKCNKLMESIVRTITFTDDQSSSVLNEPGVGPAAALRARHWTCLEGPGRFGRFVPDTELGALDVAEAAKAAAASYEEYLRAETQSADTEMDVQVGEYTLKKNRLRSLPPEISTQADFVTVFGVSHNLNPIQCVEVQTTPRRTWLRLVGQRHDVQLWDADERTPEIPYVRAYQGVSGRNSNVIPAGLASGEQWISRVLEPFRKQYLRECELFLPEWDHSKQTFATLAGVARPPADGAGPPPPRVLKEVVVFREWKVSLSWLLSLFRWWYLLLLPLLLFLLSLLWRVVHVCDLAAVVVAGRPRVQRGLARAPLLPHARLLIGRRLLPVRHAVHPLPRRHAAEAHRGRPAEGRAAIVVAADHAESHHCSGAAGAPRLRPAPRPR